MKEQVYISCDAFAGHNALKISARYDKGEWNRPRGYYLTIMAVQREPQFEAYSSDSPYQRYLVERVERKNPTKYKAFVEKINRNAQKIADAFVGKRFDEVWQYV